MNKNIIRIYGDSLSMPRAAAGISFQDTYGEKLKRELLEKSGIDYVLYNRSNGSRTVVTTLQLITTDDIYFGKNGENSIVIIQVGLCDLAPRPVPQKVRNKISKLPSILKDIIIKFLHNNRKYIQKYKYFQLVSPKDFEIQYNEMLKICSTEFEKVICINVPPTHPETEEHTPELSINIERYNEIIARLVKNNEYRHVYLADVNKILAEKCKNGEDLHDYILDDGQHITIKGNELYKNILIDIISDR